LTHLAFAIPGDLDAPTGGYAYDRRMIAGLRALGWTVDVVPLGDGFPAPSRDDRNAAMVQLRALPSKVPVVVDGLALGALPEAETLRDSHCLVALVHHPLALETGLSTTAAQALRDSERNALRGARHVVVTSDATARTVVADYGVDASSITVIKPGTDRRAAASGSKETLSLLAVGSLVPRKGYDLLLAALAQLADLPWRLTIAGSSRDETTARQVADDIVRYRLGDRVRVAGAVSDAELAKLYNSADVFVLASRFEGFGMVYSEAVAHGLPVIGTTAGAIREAVPEGAGLLVPPEDVPALTVALRTMIGDESARRTYAETARRVASSLPTWDDAALRFARTIERLT
jgi:glycosyltransferase involved in cell wall biosynthesis